MNVRIVYGIQEIISDQLMIELIHLDQALSQLEIQRGQPLEGYFYWH